MVMFKTRTGDIITIARAEVTPGTPEALTGSAPSFRSRAVLAEHGLNRFPE